jgi:hypothetical protein
MLPKTRCEEIVNSIEDLKQATALQEIWKLLGSTKSLSQPAT